ncbi:MAG: hypothetical protein KIH01_05555 [Candidatus Freyarchaeota archaeon]|nr:hypothetical protein [Candidatus Jordarchaeia archaeon]
MIKRFFRLLSRYDSYGAVILVLLSTLLGSAVAAMLKREGFLTPLAALTIVFVTALSLGGFTALLYLEYLRKREG